MPTGIQNDIEQKRKLLEIVREVMERDQELREQYQIGEKFRFVRDRLNALANHLEQALPAANLDQSKATQGLAEDEAAVYVYLYNAQGLQFRTWQNLVNPKVFYEYSVNRPIYESKAYIEELLRTKTNKVQHAYLTIAVKKDKIIKAPNEAKDIVGNPLIKVKEGSLHFDNVIAFSHNGHDYVINKEGLLVAK